MFQRLLHVLYAIEFLLALLAVYTVWGEVGGQIHLDDMAWYWKAVVGFPAAFATVRLTLALASDSPKRRRRVIAWILVLVLLAVCAGLLTYYYYLNEPQDENDNPGATTPAAVRGVDRRAAGACFTRGRFERPIRRRQWIVPHCQISSQERVGIGTGRSRPDSVARITVDSVAVIDKIPAAPGELHHPGGLVERKWIRLRRVNQVDALRAPHRRRGECHVTRGRRTIV
jgi:hypothetical protein